MCFNIKQPTFYFYIEPDIINHYNQPKDQHYKRNEKAFTSSLFILLFSNLLQSVYKKSTLSGQQLYRCE